MTWVSSSGVVAKVLSDLDRLGNRETPAILNLLVIEDLAMAAYLPIAAALVADRGLDSTVIVVAVALLTVMAILWSAVRFGPRLSELIAPGTDEAVLLAVFGLTLFVAGLAQQLQVSAAIGAFLVGLALRGPCSTAPSTLIRPLRDLFAATFFLFFSFQISPGSLVGRGLGRPAAERGHGARQARVGLGGGPLLRRRRPRTPAGGHGADRPGGVLDRGGGARRVARGRRAARRARRRLRAR